MNDEVALIFKLFLYVLLILIVFRSLMSWFPVDQRNPVAQFLYTVTEPILEPIRRVMPRLGMIDLSGMVAVVLLYVMIAVVQRAAS